MTLDEITALYRSKEALDGDGRLFLADRRLSIPEAYKAGICSANGNLYFLFFKDGQIIRFKGRSLTSKKYFFNSQGQTGSDIPFFSHSKGSTIDYLVITEGELDCVALRSLGCLNCVSLPNGSQSVETSFKSNYKYLQQFPVIYIGFDMDKCGHDAAKKALELIGPERYRRINFPRKDANDWLMQDEPEPQDFINLMQNATKIDCEEIFNVQNLPKPFYDKIDLGIHTGFGNLDHIIRGWRTGELTVISADTGSGKTTFSLNVFQKIANRGHSVWINSYEMDPRITNRKIASAVLQKKMKFEDFSDEDVRKYNNWAREKKMHVNISNKKIDIKAFETQVERAAMVYGVRYILVDHLDYLYNISGERTSLQAIDEAMRNLHIMCMKYNVFIMLVVHPKQMSRNEEVSMSDLRGSSSIKQYADNVILLTRMNRTDPNDLYRVKLRVAKNRLCGIEGHITLQYVPEYDGYREGYDLG